ncbi:hypothetical protein ACIA8C_09560 [Nocardia sp. NPDC051321]|uniref:hypothetical protein n=1 Tax=Nocardia sp. NPDC051321 TaxID=3364323 RepID=UPI0037AF6832
MECTPAGGSGTSKGLHIGLNVDAVDNGDRPIAKNPDGNLTYAFWISPNMRLVPANEIIDPATGKEVPDKWLKASYWNNKDLTTQQVDTLTDYRLVLRVRNTDVNSSRFNLKMEACVSDLNASAPGMDYAILQDPESTTNKKKVSFTLDLLHGNSEVPSYDPANPDDPSKMAVLVGKEIWRPRESQLKYNNGHVCLVANVWDEGYSGGERQLLASEPDGGQSGAYILPFCDRRHGQRNLNIVVRKVGATETRNVLVAVPASDRCPLEGEVALKAVELQQGEPQLAGLATSLGLNDHHCPPHKDPMEGVTIDDHGDPSHELGICLQPGEKIRVPLTVAPYDGEKPGDVYAFDMITKEESNNSVYGATRFYVMVTA